MKNKHKFELQKSKAILLCGALLATVTFATAQANADEQTATPTVATKNVVSDATKPKTEDAKKLEPTSDKVEVVEVPKNDNLTGSLDEASKTGTKPEITQTEVFHRVLPNFGQLIALSEFERVVKAQSIVKHQSHPYHRDRHSRRQEHDQRLHLGRHVHAPVDGG